MTRATLSLGLLAALAACGHAPRLPVAPAPIVATRSVPVEGAPVEGAPVKAAPLEGAPVEAAPVEGAPVEGAPDAVPVDVARAQSLETAASSATSHAPTGAAPATDATAHETTATAVAAASGRDPESGLPTPPNEEPRLYATWLASLPRADQRQIASFCAKHPVEYQAPCGGIGPLHIPMPPSRVAMRPPGAPTWEEWRKALTPRQKAYFEGHCKSEEESYSTLCGATPLVLSFDGEPVMMTPAHAGARFAFVPGDPVSTDWPSSATPWLALDRDGDGAITSGAELFGSSTALSNGRAARDGFEALRALDANGDGKIDRNDPAFARLVAWSDRNGDRRSTPDELTNVGAIVESISLAERIAPRCDARLNCERERAAMTFRSTDGHAHEGAVVDMYLQFR